MAYQHPRGSSTAQSTGKVLSREELRRKLNEQVATKSLYAAPQDVKSKEQAGTSALAARQPRPVTPADSAKDENSGRQKTVKFSLMSDTPQATSSQGLVPGEGELDADIRLYEDYDGKVQGVLELSTVRQSRKRPIKVRVICLIDVSGSMLLKGNAQRSKISILKSMAGDIIDALEDDEDFFGVMTFGQESRVICPLTMVSPSTRIKAKKGVSQLDQEKSFSAVTDLSTALQQAVQMLSDAHKDDQSLLYRHSIIIFSDGEVNAGVTQPEKLVHVTRDAIRKGFRYPDTLNGDLWINVSCVTTGANVSTALYLLSKMCGSDAYLFVDGKSSSSSSSGKSHPETDMLIPLMLRKTACAQTVSVTVRGLNGAAVRASECSREYSVRRKKGRASVGRGSGKECGGAGEGNEMCYFIHDIPRGGKKSFNIAVDVERVTSRDEPFLTVDVQYVTALGEIGKFSKKVRRREILPITSEKPEAMESVAKTGICALREIFQETARAVTGFLEAAASNKNGSHDQGDNDAENVAASISVAVQTGKEKVKALDAEVLSKVDASVALDARSEYEDFSTAVKANLGKLVSQGAGGSRGSGRKLPSSGRQWQMAKAMSSAVARQLPTVSDVLSKSAVLCPDLAAAAGDSEGMSARMQALSMYVGQASPLFGAAQLVANSLAEVLEALGTGESM